MKPRLHTLPPRLGTLDTRRGKPPPKRADPFYYSAAWHKLKRAAHSRDGYRCVVSGCGRDVSAPGAARPDHIKPVKTHPHLALDIDNVRTLCAEHDNQSHREKGKRNNVVPRRDERFIVKGCGADGWPVDPQHAWNKTAAP